ncbi:MAG: Holliday junction resolvase RuvX [Proteobacteria bacterium]|jgi:putative Holliday junction resolvase|nr:Holliday junction resolvase RuvX [Pseudomonadota bacterium]
MRILALDIGEKRIGVSLSDELGITAQGLETINRTKLSEDIDKIRQIVTGAGVTEIVLGLPLNLDGSEGQSAQKAMDFAVILRRDLGVDVILWDERLSTVAAERSLLEGDLSRRRRKQLRDQVAATLILQGYLDSLSHSGAN